jgi:hypothetical protein
MTSYQMGDKIVINGGPSIFSVHIDLEEGYPGIHICKKD